MLIWGVHVHVGVRRDHAMPIVSSLLKWYPHLQALSASSPIWAGTDTGYASNRAMMFQQLPTAGLPFQFETWADFEAYAHDLIATGVIEEIDEIRWDVRPAPQLGTVEVRICDGVSTLDRDARAGGAHPLPGRRPLRAPRPRRDSCRRCRPWHVQENKWRAARYGLDAWIILDEHSNECLMQDDLRRAARAAGPGGRAARLRRRPRPRRGDPAARCVLPAAARGRRAHRRRPRRGRRLGGARALSRLLGERRDLVGRGQRVHAGDGEQVGDQRADLGEDHLGGQVAGALDLRRSPGPARPAGRARRWPHGRPPSSSAIASVHVGEVVQQGGVRRRDGLVAGSTPPPPGAPAPGCCAARSPAARPARPSPAPGRGGGAGTARSVRRRAPRRPPRGARRPARRWTVRRCSTLSDALDVAVEDALGRRAQQRRRSCARRPPACSRGRRSGARGTTAAATSATAPPISASVQRMKAAPGVGSSALTKIAWIAAWLTNSTPWSSSSAVDIARRDDQRDLPATRADPGRDQRRRRAPRWPPRRRPRRPGAAAGRRTCRG